MTSNSDVSEHGQKRLFIIHRSRMTQFVVGTALVLLPLLELWREQININDNFYLFTLDLICMVVVSLDACLVVYFKNLQLESHVALWESMAGFFILLYPLLWICWTLQQLGIIRLASTVMPLLLFVKHSELRLTVTIFIRYAALRMHKCELVCCVERLPAAERCCC